MKYTNKFNSFKFKLNWNFPKNLENGLAIYFKYEYMMETVYLFTPFWYGLWSIHEFNNKYTIHLDGVKQTNLNISKKEIMESLFKLHMRFSNALAIAHSYFGYYLIEKDKDDENFVAITSSSGLVKNKINIKNYQKIIEYLHLQCIYKYIEKNILSQNRIKKKCLILN